MVENVTQTKSGITINVCVNVQMQNNIMCAKEIIFGILLHVVSKMVHIEEVLLMIQRLHVMKLKKKHKLLKYYFNKGVLTNFYILLCFLLTIKALLMPANIYS